MANLNPYKECSRTIELALTGQPYDCPEEVEMQCRESKKLPQKARLAAFVANDIDAEPDTGESPQRAQGEQGAFGDAGSIFLRSALVYRHQSNAAHR